MHDDFATSAYNHEAGGTCCIQVGTLQDSYGFQRRQQDDVLEDKYDFQRRRQLSLDLREHFGFDSDEVFAYTTFDKVIGCI